MNYTERLAAARIELAAAKSPEYREAIAFHVGMLEILAREEMHA